MRYQLLLTAIVIAGGGVAPAVRADDVVDFQRDIRPILAENCFKCHGLDAEARKSKLRLDGREYALQGGRSGKPAIVPNKPDESDLIRRVESTLEADVMPPTKTGKKLTPQQRELLRRWVASGAIYQQHWSLVPPTRSPLPKVQNAGWVRSPIDAFILARLEQEGLKPSSEASKETLLRRLSLDLTGLPPTPEEIDAFLKDAAPNAYEKVVERLLASPHYGERWGRLWLDGARYADSDGFEKDKPRQVWMYRDWVVNAFNRDLPYDQFVIEQLAGDLLPKPTQEQRIATGFLRNSMINEEGGIDPEQFRMAAMVDRMDALGKSVLGLTIQCTQCHTHKYDPFTQEDYYRLFAYLNDTNEANIAVYPPVEQKKRAEILRKIRELEAWLGKSRTPDLQAHRKWKPGKNTSATISRSGACCGWFTKGKTNSATSNTPTAP